MLSCPLRFAQTILVMSALLGPVKTFYPDVTTPSEARFEEFSDKAMASLDSDESGNISRPEFQKFVSAELDADGSGALSAEEFLKYFVVLLEATADAEKAGQKAHAAAQPDQNEGGGRYLGDGKINVHGAVLCV